MDVERLVTHLAVLRMSTILPNPTLVLWRAERTRLLNGYGYSLSTFVSSDGSLHRRQIVPETSEMEFRVIYGHADETCRHLSA